MANKKVMERRSKMQTFKVAVYVDLGYCCRYVYKTIEAASREEAEAEVQKAKDAGTICFLVNDD